jgi:hypothetical protein
VTRRRATYEPSPAVVAPATVFQDPFTRRCTCTSTPPRPGPIVPRIARRALPTWAPTAVATFTRWAAPFPFGEASRNEVVAFGPTETLTWPVATSRTRCQEPPHGRRSSQALAPTFRAMPLSATFFPCVTDVRPFSERTPIVNQLERSPKRAWKVVPESWRFPSAPFAVTVAMRREALRVAVASRSAPFGAEEPSFARNALAEYRNGPQLWYGDRSSCGSETETRYGRAVVFQTCSMFAVRPPEVEWKNVQATEPLCRTTCPRVASIAAVARPSSAGTPL